MSDDRDRDNPNVSAKGAGWWCRIHHVWTGERGWCYWCSADEDDAP